mmetsp:Transcript_21821/g.64711  ORF Transcript_21821/g.64711 Transcript_21821/m.64711 type:complete len:281 (+) Transcript_21821:382-1224(+)
MLKLASSASMSSTRICGPVRSTSRSLERVMWSLCASFTIPSHVAAMPWQYWKSGSTSNGSSTCTPMSSVPSMAHATNVAASGVAVPTIGQSTNGIALHQTIRKREQCRVKAVGMGVRWMRSQAPIAPQRRWKCRSRSCPSRMARSGRSPQRAQMPAWEALHICWIVHSGRCEELRQSSSSRACTGSDGLKQTVLNSLRSSALTKAGRSGSEREKRESGLPPSIVRWYLSTMLNAFVMRQTFAACALPNASSLDCGIHCRAMRVMSREVLTISPQRQRASL